MLAEYKITLSKPLNPRTVIFLLKKDKVLLGYKKTGFGKGYYVGIGGKVEDGETTEDAAIRELKEEVGIDAVSNNLTEMAILNFYFPEVKDESWNQEVHAYIVKEWKGEPLETEEIKPAWFDIKSLPIEEMWDDAQYWIPSILGGEKVYEEYLFDKNLKVIEHQKF